MHIVILETIHDLCNQSKDMDYKEFKKSFELSGLTQRAYGEQLSMSNSMVSYYLKKAKALEVKPDSSLGFKKLEIEATVNQSIKITLLSGVQIEIPI